MTPSIFEKSACDLENCSLDYEISSRRDKRDTDAEKFEDNNVCSVCESCFWFRFNQNQRALMLLHNKASSQTLMSIHYCKQT